MSDEPRQREYIVGRADDIPPGTVRIVPVGRYGVGVFNVGGHFHALTNYCPHRGARLCQGEVTGTAVATDTPYSFRWERDGEILRCPWHAWEFDIATGRSLVHPEKSIRQYTVTVRHGLVVLEGVTVAGNR